MTASSLAALLTAATAFLGALGTFLHSAQTRRIVRRHEADRSHTGAGLNSQH